MKALLATLIALAPIAALAGNVPLVNAGFENPTPDDNTYPWLPHPDGPFVAGVTSANPIVPGWTVDQGIGGLWRPNLGPNTFASLPEGVQAGFTGANDLSGLMHQDTGHVFAAGETVTFSAFLGHRSDLLNFGGIDGGEGFLQIRTADGNLLADSGILDAPIGQFEQFSVSYLVGANDSAIGKTLRIELGSPLRHQASWDLVSVNAVPEPSTLAFGAMATLAFARRRRK